MRWRITLAVVAGSLIAYSRNSGWNPATDGCTRRAVVMAGCEPESGDGARSAADAARVGKLVTMTYGQDDELQSDLPGVRFRVASGDDPEAPIDVMEILRMAGGGSSQAKFFSSPPDPDNRIQGTLQTSGNTPTYSNLLTI